MKKILFLFLFLAIPSLSYADAPVMVGGDRDTYGCIGSAGYSWSVTLGKCIRSWEYYTIDIEHAPSTGVSKLDKMIARQTEVLEKQFRKDAEEIIADMSGETIDPTRYVLNISYEIVNTGSVVSVKMDVYRYLGGAHGSTSLSTWNYDTKTKRVISLWKVLTPKKLRDISIKTEKKLQDYYTKEGYPLDPAWLQEGVNPRNAKNYSTFTLKTDALGSLSGMLIYFADYQVGPHAIGMPMVAVDLRSGEVKNQN